MSFEKHTKTMYDKFGKEYQRTRTEKDKSRAYNEFLEVPNMIKAVGNIKGKKLLDIGCGAGVHIKKYLAKGAKCSGLDISKTMIELARKNCPNVDFKVGSMTKLPYPSNSFDIVTASLCLNYIENWTPVMKEVFKVLKKGGLFYYSDSSVVSVTREVYDDKDFRIFGVGRFVIKKTGKQIVLGDAFVERISEWEMVPGMKLKTYIKPLRVQLNYLRKSGFELVDVIDCKPTLGFKKVNPDGYELSSKFPLFSVFVAKKL